MKIDFSKLKLQVSSNAFVGIKKENNEYIFYLPKGYLPDDLKPKELKTLFFQLYGVMKKYKQKAKKRFDGTQQQKNGTGRKEENDKPVFYDNLNIENLISSYEDTKILGFNTKMLTDKTIDYNFNLEDAYFTDRNIAVVIESKKENTILSYGVYDIVTMYSFILYDIFKQMNIEPSPIIKQNAMSFLEKYLYPNASFFEGEDISEMCKDILYKIDKQSFHSDEYNKFYEQVYKFLYSHPDKDGIIMGIDNFHSIWEELCFHYFFKYHRDDILFADYEKEANCFNRMYCKEKDNYPFKITYGNEIKYMYPDLVINSIYKINVILIKDLDTFWNVSHIEKVKELIKNVLLKEKKLKESKYILLLNFNSANEYWVYTNWHPFIYKMIENEIITLDRTTHIEFYPENIEQLECNKKVINCIKKWSKQNFNNSYLNYTICKKEILKEWKFSYIKGEEIEKAIKIIQETIDIVDFKYKTENDIDNIDKIKQKFYEFSIYNNKINENKLILPLYNNKDLLITDEKKENDIIVEYWNISFLLQEYIND